MPTQATLNITPPRKDPVRVLAPIGVYIVVFWSSQIIFFLVLGMAGVLAGVTLSNLAGALFANWLALRIYENRALWEIGLYANRASVRNLAFGLGGGIGIACLVLGPPLLTGAAHLGHTAETPSPGTLAFVTVLLMAGAMGEEALFHGYPFQILVKTLGAWPAVLAVGLVFGLMHSANPNATWFGLANTAGFGFLFGYAFLRSRDLWLPIGLHFGWNFTLPVFGVNLSGLKMGVTAHEMVWTAGPLWSGGAYGPEASVLTSAALAVLFLYLWKAPLSRQESPLLGPAVEGAVCERSPSPPS